MVFNQHVINDKRGFSINMSHMDLYGNLRFLSASAQQNILKKHLLKIYLLKYFDHNQEYASALPEYLIRGSVEFTIKKNYMLGIGSIVTTYENQVPEIGLSLEGRIRW